MIQTTLLLVLAALFWLLVVCPLTGRKLGGAGISYAGSLAIGAWLYSAVFLSLAMGATVVTSVYLVLSP